MAEFGAIDILVNNAGIIIVKPIVPTLGWSPPLAGLVSNFNDGFDDQDWYRILESNLTSVFRCCQAVVPHMMAKKKGRIINISSIDADHGLPDSNV